MELLIIVTFAFYLLSTAGYIAYLCVQKKDFYRVGHYLLLAGFIIHTSAIVLATVRSGSIPVQNLHETLLLSGWAVAGVYLVFQHRYKLKILGVYAAPLAAIIVSP